MPRKKKILTEDEEKISVAEEKPKRTRNTDNTQLSLFDPIN